MTRKKKKKLNDEINGEKNQIKNINQDNTSPQEEISSQEEINTLTSKRKPYNISPPEHQPKSKMANLSTTPKPTADGDSISSEDSDRLAIDESRQLTEDLNTTDITNVTKDLGLDEVATLEMTHGHTLTKRLLNLPSSNLTPLNCPV